MVVNQAIAFYPFLISAFGSEIPPSGDFDSNFVVKIQTLKSDKAFATPLPIGDQKYTYTHYGV